MLALIGRKEMYDHVAVVHHQPAFARLSLDATLFLVILFQGFQHALGERVQHAVAGAVADDEIIGKSCDLFDVEEQDVFALFVLQGIDDFMSKIKSVQVSPHRNMSLRGSKPRSNLLFNQGNALPSRGSQ